MRCLVRRLVTVPRLRLGAPSAAVFLCAGSVVAQPAFEVLELPDLGGPTAAGEHGLVVVSDANGSAVIAAGWTTDTAGTRVAATWEVPAGQPPEPVLPLTALDPSQDSWANVVLHDATLSVTHAAGASMSQSLVLPVMWEQAAGDPSFGNAVPLPTLAGAEGEVLAGAPEPCYLVGTSADSGGTDRAVAWAEGRAGFLLDQLPDLGGAARATAAAHPTPCFFAAGWAVNAVGDTIPQLWDGFPGLTWNRASLPLLANGTHGWAWDMEINASTMTVAGSATTAAGDRHGVRWTSTDGGQTWTVTDLGALTGLPESTVDSVVDELQGIVVLCGHAGDGTGKTQGTLWTDDGQGLAAHDLNALVPDGSSLALETAKVVKVDPDGTIIVFGDGVGGAAAPGNAVSRAYLARQIGATVVPPAGSAAGSLRLVADPNPFTQSTRVSFTLPAPSRVRLAVHDVAGRRIAVLADDERAAGRHAISWTGRDAGGRAAPPGVYLVRLEVAGVAATRKVVLVR